MKGRPKATSASLTGSDDVLGFRRVEAAGEDHCAAEPFTEHGWNVERRLGRSKRRGPDDVQIGCSAV